MLLVAGSLKFSGPVLMFPTTSNRVTFGTGDYTLEAWIQSSITDWNSNYL